MVLCRFVKQPEHLLYDFESATKKLGSERAEQGSYLFRSLMNSNAQLAFGSDWPVSVPIQIYFWLLTFSKPHLPLSSSRCS